MRYPAEIGTLEIEYDRYGKVLSVKFTPAIKIEADATLIEEFNKIEPKPSELRIRVAGEMLLSKFFNQVTNIELADREKFDIKSDTLSCERFSNGLVSKCIIVYSLVEI